jgi:hypothetical protein
VEEVKRSAEIRLPRKACTPRDAARRPGRGCRVASATHPLSEQEKSSLKTDPALKAADAVQDREWGKPTQKVEETEKPPELTQEQIDAEVRRLQKALKGL